MRTSRLLLSLALASASFVACTDDVTGDAADAAFSSGGKADGSSWSGADVAGALRAAGALDEDQLVSDVGLTKHAASGIVAARPFHRLADLDAVPYVGPVALGRLVDYATTQGWTSGDMVEVAAGAFQMGDTEKPTDFYQPLHEVTVSRFWLDRLEVTNADWRACVDDGVCPLRGHDSHLATDYETADEYGSYPVVDILWREAQAYCEWAGKMLPTEAQWEKAARGTADLRKFPWGDTQLTCELTNYAGHCGALGSDLPMAVGTHPDDVSPYGVLDMEGNVTEWVYDAWTDKSDACGPSCVDPVGPPNTDASFHSSRGASFANAKFTFGTAIYDREEWLLDYWNPRLGFRCAVQ
jgi:formylglycine-generating enzyme required for sulfatase activity